MERCTGEPFRLVVELATPAALYGWPWVMLDGLIAHLALRERAPDRFRTLPTSRVYSLAELLGGEPLPLEQAGPVLAGSAWAPDAGARGYDVVFKRFPRGWLPEHRLRGRVSTAKGELRDWRVGLVLVPARRVVFYGRGDPRAVERLVSRGLAALGARRASGYGLVRSVRVERTGEDWSLVGPDGRAARPLPVEMLEWHEGPLFYGVPSPPYWDRRRVTLMAAPGARVRLRREYACEG